MYVLDSQLIEQTDQQPKEVALIDRAHHLLNLADIIRYYKDFGGNPEQSGFKYSWSTTRSIEEVIHQQYLQIDSILSIKESLDLLLKFKWVRRIIQFIVEKGFELTYYQSLKTLLPDWENSEDQIKVILALLILELTDDVNLITSLKIDTQALDKAKEHLGYTIKEFIELNRKLFNSINIDLLKLLIETLNLIITNTCYRKSLLPLIYSAPIYLNSFFIRSLEDASKTIDYYKDLGVEQGVENYEGAKQFESMRLLSQLVIEAYVSTPEYYIELNTLPGAICQTAGSENMETGKHCLRKRIADSDQIFIEALAIACKDFPKIGQHISFTLDINGGYTHAFVPFFVLGKKEFIERVKEYYVMLVEDKSLEA